MEATRREDEAHLNLRWEDHSHTFVHLLDHFRLEGLYCDATLACAGGAVYPVHKVVLSACSEFFASIFASASCHKPVVVLQDVAGEELEALLTYMYRGHVQLPRHTLHGFLKVAQSLHVKGLSPPSLSLLNDTCHTWAATNGDTPSPDASLLSTLPTHTSLHPSSHHTHPPPPYPHHDRLPLPPERDEAWSEEGGARSGAPLPQSLRSQEDSHKPPRKRYSPLFGGSEQFGGTFQNLVASEEEGSIKEEPQEEMEEGEEEEEEMEQYSANRLTICEKDEDDEGEVMKEEAEAMSEGRDEGAKKEEEEEEDKRMLEECGDERQGRGKEEEGKEERRRIMVEIRPPSTPTVITPNGTTPSPTPSHATLSPTSSIPTLSPLPGHPALSPLPNTPPTTPSQLRRELLKPLHSRPHNAPHPHHSIPHPVIHSRDGDAVGVGVGVGVPREPPPLVKIPTSPPAATPPLHPALPHHYTHHLHPLHSRQSDGPDNTTTTTITTTKTHHQHHHNHHHHHLLVTAQPTYRPRLVPQPPTHIAYPTLTPLKVTALMDSDTPLNLSQDHNPKRPQPRPLHIPTTQGMGGGERRVRDSKDPFLGKIMTNRKRRLRGPKSWEYLVRLLKDPTTNPSLIRWENEAKGVFRLVQPGVIAQRWGRRTGKHASECLSYENFARGLRYHYATGALQPVSERSFVYKFGPKALLALGDDSREYLVPEISSPTATVPYSTASTPTATAAAARL